MRLIHRRRWWPAVLCVSLVCVWAVNAAPIKTQKKALVDELKALARLHRVELVIKPPRSTELRDAELGRDELVAIILPMLRDAGFDVVQHANITPKLVFNIWSNTDENVPGAVGYGIYCDVVQKVHVERLDQTLTVPTSIIAVHGVTRLDLLNKEFKGNLESLVKKFIFLQEYATQNR